ncbi:MAG: urea ABC transporter substrate-binding protein [Gallionellaceae bacterium]|jgi:urea transport system substrate-binding protein
MKSAKIIALIFFALCIAAAGLYFQQPTAKPIKVGVLHSLTGTMASSELPLVDMLQFAFEEINAAGGLLGRKIQPIVADCQSDAAICAQQAERLITQEQVSVLFGCWTSACRKAVKPVVEKHHHLLFYPLQYEGMEQSHNIVYIGATPTQQIIPAVYWAMENLGKDFYLIGSDYVFPRTANLITNDLIASQGGKVLGERYLPLGSADMSAVIADLKKIKKAVVLNTINGDSNLHFFKALREAGISAQDMPVFSFSIAEAGFVQLPVVENQYSSWSYFQSLPGEANARFVKAFRQRFGAERVIGDPMESSYVAVKLWQQSVLESRSFAPEVIASVVLNQSLPTPGGIVAIDSASGHAWRVARIGRTRSDGQIDILWESNQLLAPNPFPLYRTRESWERMLNNGRRP